MFDKILNLFKKMNFEANAKLEDGTELIIKGNLAIGVEVTIMGPDGEMVLPDGEYTLDTGELIVVTDGSIVDIVEVVPDEEVVVEEVLEEAIVDEPQPTEEVTEVVEEVNIIEEKLAALEQRLVAVENLLTNDVGEMKKEFNSQIKTLTDAIQKVSVVKPVKKNSDEVIKKDNDLYAYIREARAKINNNK